MDAKMYLFSGVTMSAELEANAKTERRFITVGGYIDIGGRTFTSLDKGTQPFVVCDG